MTLNVNFDSEDKFVPGVRGLGAKVVTGKLTITPHSAAVHYDDVRLNQIKSLFIEQNTVGSFVTVSLDSPGSYGNWASLTAYNLNGTGGYLATRSAGTLTCRFAAFGD